MGRAKRDEKLEKAEQQVSRFALHPLLSGVVDLWLQRRQARGCDMIAVLCCQGWP